MLDPENDRKAALMRAYQRGWATGAAGKKRDERLAHCKDLEMRRAYIAGHVEGVIAASNAFRKEGQRLGFDPSRAILR